MCPFASDLFCRTILQENQQTGQPAMGTLLYKSNNSSIDCNTNSRIRKKRMGLFKIFSKDKLKKLGNSLANEGLPLLANALTGGAAGTVLNLLTGTLGLKNNDSDAVEKALQNNPEALVKLKELETTHKEELQKLALEMARVDMQHDQAYLSDKASARNRELEITKSTGKRDINLYVLAWTVVLAFFVLTAVLIYNPLEGTAVGYINQLFGAMATGFGLVLSYFFGSSRGSAHKQALMHEQSMSRMEKDVFDSAKG